MDATEVGSVVSSLAGGDHCAAELLGECPEQKGGTASAEQSDYYSVLMKDTVTYQSTGSLFNAPVFAAPATQQTDTNPDKNRQICENGKPIQQGELVCAESKAGQSNSFIDSADNALKATGLAQIASAYRKICVIQ